ncbi:MAG: hypothetical protein HY231_24110 [Acidobacteria bacterium]|nr:hypothetical protein [Acidobacteriota bacterium]
MQIAQQEIREQTRQMDYAITTVWIWGDCGTAAREPERLESSEEGYCDQCGAPMVQSLN